MDNPEIPKHPDGSLDCRKLAKNLVGTEFAFNNSSHVGPEDGALRRQSWYHFQHVTVRSEAEVLKVVAQAELELARRARADNQSQAGS